MNEDNLDPLLQGAPSSNIYGHGDPSAANVDERIGYRRPPKHSRFKPGKSGNPRGRPKGGKSVGDIVTIVMSRKVSVTENGATRRVSAIEAIFHRLRSEALRGDKAALKILLPLLERYAEAGEGALGAKELMAEDLEVLARYAKAVGAAPEEARSAEATEPGADGETATGGAPRYDP